LAPPLFHQKPIPDAKRPPIAAMKFRHSTGSCPRNGGNAVTIRVPPLSHFIARGHTHFSPPERDRS